MLMQGASVSICVATVSSTGVAAREEASGASVVAAEEASVSPVVFLPEVGESIVEAAEGSSASVAAAAVEA